MAKSVLPSLLGLLFVSAFGTCIYNALQFKSQQIDFALPLSREVVEFLHPQKNEEEQKVTLHQAALQRFSRALQFPTISHHNDSQTDDKVWDAFLKFLEDSYPLFHKKLIRESSIPSACSHSRLFKWEGSDSSLRPFLLLAHMDVVPVEPGTEKDWTHPPFGGVEADGFIWGRGALDMKSGVTSIFEAVELLLQKNFRPKRTAYISFGHDEEVGGQHGNSQISNFFEEKNLRFEFVLDEGGALAKPGMLEGMNFPVAMIGIAEKGMMNLQFGVETIGGHASTPLPETPIGILSTALSTLEKNPMPSVVGGVFKRSLEFLAPEMPFFNRIVLGNLWLFGPVLKSWVFERKPTTAASIRTTIAPTMFIAGTKENVLPKKATAIANVRILPGNSVRSVIKYVKETINDDRVKISIYKNLTFEPSEISSTVSPGWNLLTHTIAQLFPKVFQTPYLTMMATDSRYFHSLSDSVYRFLPYQVEQRDLQRIHGTDERIAVGDYINMIAFMTQLIQNAQAKQFVSASHSHDEL